MTDQEMMNEEKESKPVENEFKRLGNNLQDTLKAAWDSEERKTISLEIENGLKVDEHYASKGAFTLKAQLSKGAFGDGHNH